MDSVQRVHFIAIGGAVMHNLAIALKNKGYSISGSDDEITSPSFERLRENQLLPEKMGWFPDKITQQLDAVILGMHAKADNPELKKAQELGLKIYSYPEYVYHQCEDKQRVVIAGSHGKTTIAAMVLHVLHYHHRKVDYLVGAQVEGFDAMVQLTEDAPLVIIEGDEYPASILDKNPKFMLYKHHIGLISGIAWDHINVYHTFDEYVKQFELFADATPKGGALVYIENDDLVTIIGRKERPDVARLPYKIHKHTVRDGKTYLITESSEEVLVHVFGDHNMENINAARLVCSKIGISRDKFYEAISEFKGAANRLQLVGQKNMTRIFKDFAHSPSKLKASTHAVKKQFPQQKLVACMELHTYSSLTKEFLKQYADTLKSADEAIVYYNPHTVAMKNLTPFQEEDIKKGFNINNVIIFTDSLKLHDYLLSRQWTNATLLLMSSGNFNGMDISQLSKKIIESI